MLQPSPEHATCEHSGRVRPVVWMVTADGEVPNTVVCEQCFRAISANAVAHANYTEGADGWYDKSPLED